jgi:hypothetical protein
MTDRAVAYCWGPDQWGQLGSGTVSTTPRNEPVKVAGQP